MAGGAPQAENIGGRGLDWERSQLGACCPRWSFKRSSLVCPAVQTAPRGRSGCRQSAVGYHPTAVGYRHKHRFRSRPLVSMY